MDSQVEGSKFWASVRAFRGYILNFTTGVSINKPAWQEIDILVGDGSYKNSMPATCISLHVAKPKIENLLKSMGERTFKLVCPSQDCFAMAENQRTEPSDKEPGELTDPTIVLPRTYGSLLGSNIAPKLEWPELVGLTPEEAERKIREDMPRVQIQVVEANSIVTMDFNQGRVRLYLDPSGNVQRTPRIG